MDSINTQLNIGKDLSIVIPTFNESENIVVLLDRLADVLAPLNFEIIVVDDDSPDLTWKVVETYALNNERVRVIRRMAMVLVLRSWMLIYNTMNPYCPIWLIKFFSKGLMLQLVAERHQVEVTGSGALAEKSQAMVQNG